MRFRQPPLVCSPFGSWCAKFSRRVEDVLSKLKESSGLRLTFHQAARRGSKYLDTIMERHPKQWQFYKEVRVLNPRNLPDLSPDVSRVPTLSLPTENDAFAEWQRYCRVVDVFPSDPASLWEYWSKHSGVLADCAKFLISVPVTSADVEPVPFPRGRNVRFLAFHYILRRCTVAGRLHNPLRTNFIRRILTYSKSGTKPRSFSLAGVMDTKLRHSLTLTILAA